MASNFLEVWWFKGAFEMKGLGTSPGIGIGKVFIYEDSNIEIIRRNVIDANMEWDRFLKAISQASLEIDNLYNKTYKEVGKNEAEIFVAHRMMLEDPDFSSRVKERIIQENINCEYAIKEVVDYFLGLFASIEDEYLKSRSIDIKDVSNRLLNILQNKKTVDLSKIDEKTIIVAKDLTPSDTAQMNKEMVVGIVTEQGGKTSHTSIIARSLEIPSIAGVKNITKIANEEEIIIIDGTSGKIILNPTDEEIILNKNLQNEIIEYKTRLKSMIGKKTLSKDGYQVQLFGNISLTSDVDIIIESDGEGVGLFRTEFLYIDSDRLPTEEEQFIAYIDVAKRLGDKTVVIRTLDIGGDKNLLCVNLPKELNPFLGYRAIRLCLDRQEMFRTQLRAILRASVFKNIKVMFPMISSLEEVRECKKIIEEIKCELRTENIKFNNEIKIGIMVEIPAVAIHSRAFAKEVDFFSIGTNDLIQYTLAVDRGNQDISNLYSQYHPAVLRLIQMTIENGHKEGIKVGMCGEVASDEKLIPILLAMGLDEFSMNPCSILKTRHLLQNISKEETGKKLDTILNLSTAKDVEDFIDKNILNIN